MSLLPGAVLDPGVHWNYQAGQISPINLFWHYTVGRDSRALIRDQGLAPILIWDDVIWQFAPLDACCYTQCEWNRRGPGYEVESLDGSITPGKIANLGYATLFALTTFGIPQVFYDGPRLPVGDPYRGVTNHRALVHNQCDQHYDGFDTWVWEAAIAPAPPPKKKGSKVSWLIHEVPTGKVWVYELDGHTKAWLSQAGLNAQIQARQVINFFGGSADATIHRTDDPDSGTLWAGLLADGRDIDTFAAVTPPSGGGGTLPTDYARREDVVKSTAAIVEQVNKARTVQ